MELQQGIDSGPSALPRQDAEGRQGKERPPRHSIVVVDDQIYIRELLMIRLGMVPGLEVVGQGSSGTEAISLARELSPDLMILDLRMPRC